MKHKSEKTTMVQQSYNNRSTMKKQWNTRMKHDIETQQWKTTYKHSNEKQQPNNSESNNEKLEW